MSIIRIAFSLVLLASIAILTTQNLSSSIEVTFLGVKTAPVPIALWLLAALGAGLATTLSLNILLRLWRMSISGRMSDRSIAADRDEVWEDDEWSDPAQQPPLRKPVVDADFRVIKPPTRNLEDFDESREPRDSGS